ncbi:DLW-39 family protein [Blastococcus sp. URHD0036]|nr:DLW-39 family protein [Blastococcus sp. URHD0036]
MIKRIALVAAVAATAAVVRKRSAGKNEADLWSEATTGPQAVSTPTTR